MARTGRQALPATAVGSPQASTGTTEELVSFPTTKSVMFLAPLRCCCFVQLSLPPVWGQYHHPHVCFLSLDVPVLDIPVLDIWLFVLSSHGSMNQSFLPYRMNNIPLCGYPGCSLSTHHGGDAGFASTLCCYDCLPPGLWTCSPFSKTCY